jgi:endonuclease/exonuclease/phosphatase family metal-dependent hydrolase
LQIMTFNLGLLSLVLAGRWRIDLVPFARQRLAAVPAALISSGADVILLQEVFAPVDRAMLQAAVENHFPYHASAETARKWLGSGLLILSKHPLSDIVFEPFVDHDLLHRFYRQGFLMVTVQVPNLGLLKLLNVHLSISAFLSHPESAASIACRSREIARLLEVARSYEADIVGGDFNCGPQNAAANYEAIVAAGYLDGFADCNRVEAEGHSWSRSNFIVASGRYHYLPDHRVDHLFFSQHPSARFRPTHAGLALTAPIVKTSAGAVPLSDHYAMRAGLAEAGSS